jgi:YHS domain-containing protein
MKVDRHKALTMEFAGETHYFCSAHCLHAFEIEPERHKAGTAAADEAHVPVHEHH